jgi:hypothetical protein
MTLKVLDGSLVLFGLLAGIKRPEILSLTCLWVFFA